MNKILGLLPLAAALMLTACSEDNMIENAQAPAEPTAEAKAIPFSVTVSTGEAATRAGLVNYTDPSTTVTYLKTLKFEDGDRLYITSAKGHGVLTLKTGADTNTATFEGTLSETPDADTELTATLVSNTQYVSTTQSDPDLVTIDANDAVTVNYPTGFKQETYYNDAIKKYSKLTGTAAYGTGAPSFTLAQKSVFFHIDVVCNDYVYSSGDNAYLTLKNGATVIGARTEVPVAKKGSDGYKYLSNYYVITDVDHLTSLSNATLTIEGKGFTFVKAINDVATIQGKFYNINRTIMLNVGDVIASDGKAYESAAIATAAGQTPCAMIAHIGAIDHYCDKFLAIALEDFNSGGRVNFPTANGDASTNNSLAKWAASHAITLNSTTYNTNALAGVSGNIYDEVTSSTTVNSQTATGSVIKGWRIPSVTDWRYMMAGLTSEMTPAYSATDPVGIQNFVEFYQNGTFIFDVINTAYGLNLKSGSMSSSRVSEDNTLLWYISYYDNSKNYFRRYNIDDTGVDNYYGRAVFAY